VGDTFVWEVQGDGSGVNGRGSYIAPPGTPLYPESLYLNGPPCYADCGWRLGFRMRTAKLTRWLMVKLMGWR